MTTQSTITCPKCSTKINIEDALYSQLQTKFEIDREAERVKYKEAMDKLHLQQTALKNQEQEFNKKLHDALELQLNEERVKLQTQISKDIKAKIDSENALQLKQLQEELDAKSKQVQELNASKATIAKLQREKQEIESRVKADSQIEFNKQLDIERSKALKEAQESNALKIKEKDEQLNQIKKQLDDAKRKAEQGSMQIQGEAQEKSIEDFLELNFKYDDIQEVSKGAFGADCIQTINTLDFTNCGKICYESKNTKTFSSDWIKKLKNDMLDAGADVGVLVTSAMPKEMDRMGYVDGVWVCSYEEFKGTAALIRTSMIEIYKASKSQENRVDKMSLLYTYFTSNEFSMQLQSIVEGFVAMQDELNKQKRSVMASWKRQQKQIDSVLTNTTNMYGSIKGIAGNAIANVQALELEYDEELSDSSQNEE
ncbi:DUF2130 domain-containing protein (plasmid) [Sulfurimonas aquatica]|uniref:DUF2130 domain-containing protein n=1 Tax=Sulfurimonas aquatica TaxID=2672570 RepID=A0A975B2U3_9BACT|nr:DUF2130 domain-containing protein [Sulfurimonas aquatica]QSZ43154.1 DUF2130 domain-containing protein [Sulfurimonas aquatica]